MNTFEAAHFLNETLKPETRTPPMKFAPLNAPRRGEYESVALCPVDGPPPVYVVPYHVSHPKFGAPAFLAELGRACLDGAEKAHEKGNRVA